MSNRIHALAQQLTDKATLDECSLEEVRHIAHRFPYFGPAQFLLLQKLKQSGTQEEADAQFRKAVLFYPDPLQFEYFISSEQFYVEEHEQPPVDNLLSQEINSEEIPAETPSIQEDQSEAYEDALVKTGEERVLSSLDENQEALEEVKVEEHAENEEEETSLESTDLVTDESFTRYESVNGTTDAEIPPPAPLDEPKPVPAESGLTFEPFHTVDYFASQGIKIAQDELPKDKLGKQLKSFTEWLKTMKRLPATQMTETLESSAEKKVESMASRSVSESDVVTEAMAEVWAKQGNREKAIETYNKLSLLNPSKKAYFAAKIENLKQS